MRHALELIELLEPAERLDRLRQAPEDQWFDRKSARISPRDLAETLVAFANAEGGLVAIGLWNGRATDAAADQTAVNAWRQAGIDFASPPVKTNVRTLRWINDIGEGGELVLVDVPPSDSVHATSKDEVFLRIGDENRKLTFLQRRELLFDKGQAQYDSTTPYDWTLGDLDLAKVS